MIKSISFSLFFCVFVLLTTVLHAEVRLPAIVSDSMVLQRDTKLKIWGWADPNESVRIAFRGKNYAAKTGADGKWLMWLPAMKAGGPYSMKISGKKSSITLNNILVGDVWLCAGQSNMVHYMELHQERYADEIAKVNYPGIRQFVVPTNPVLGGPASDLGAGNWSAATPKNIRRFSVVAYFFGKNLYEKYKVPIGLINSSVGGTPIEAWTSEEGLREFPDILKTIQKNKDSSYVNAMNRAASVSNKAIAASRGSDEGLTGSTKWYDPSYSPKNWKTINIPGYWEDQGIKDLDGVVWYRREIDIPASMTGSHATVALGRVVDADDLYINGVLVGSKSYKYPQRRYQVPAGLLKPGKNIFVIRVINYSEKGGFITDKPYYLATRNDTLDLKGYWQYKVGEVYNHEIEPVSGISAQNQPTALYNGMIAPFTAYAVRGALWYQGESNAGRPEEYEKLLPALIHDWRTKWSLDFPFLYAQLPNFMDVDYSPSESQWAQLRESQRKALSVDNTAMAVTIDLGEWNDIHPDNKKPIGDRLALAAQKLAYHETDVVYSGPVFTDATVSTHTVELRFSHVGSGLISQDGDELRWVALAGEDKKFVWGKATIQGNDKVVVQSDKVLHPEYVRYAWADNPEGANLFNKEGLPASPFQAQVSDVVNKLWHGKKAAVVLTYDDALEVHLDNVIPALDSLDLKASFYLSAAFPGSKNRIEDWKRAAKEGHELGNHTLFHPCDGSKPGRSWVSSQNDLSTYNTARIVREVEMTNIFLESLDGKQERTFAYTCGDMETGEGSFVDAIKDQFVSMRGVEGRINKLATLNLNNIDCFAVDNGNADQLITWAEQAKAENGLLVILFHGVGGGHNINVDLKKHNDFLKFLSEHPDDFWVTTLMEASKHGIQMSKK